MASNGKNGRKKSGKNGKAVEAKNPKNGQFVPGNSASPGRPKTSLNFMTRFGEWAAEHKTTPEKAALQLIQKLWQMAYEDGDMTAMKLLVERVFGAMDRAPLVAIQNNLHTGPPVPELQDLGRNIVKLLELGREHGIVEED